MRYFLPFLLLNFYSVLGQSNLKELRDIIRQKNFSGEILLADEGRVWFNESMGFKDFQNKVAIQKNDIFELASVSKQFTAMVIVLLQEKGKLNYDDPITQYISIPYPNITIRHLLTHTSGLPDYQSIMDKYWDKSKVAGNPEILAYLNRYAPPVLFQPGEKYEYSNTGYVLLASIAEKVTGQDFINLCRKWIFRPLKMNDTDIRTAEVKLGMNRFAKGHIFVPHRSSFIPADSFPSSNYTVWLGNRKGPGRISSTVSDLLKWDQALYSKKLVTPENLQAVFAPMRLNNGQYSSYGFGWDINTDESLGRIISHNGDNPGYKTIIIRMIDKRQTIIVLCNNASEQFEEIVSELKQAVNAHLISK